MHRILSSTIKRFFSVGALLSIALLQGQTTYGVRVGAYLHRLARTALSEDYSGFELSGDLRLKRTLFLGAELGNETFADRETLGDYLLYETTYSGSYLKFGADWLVYQPKTKEKNLVTAGVRYALSTFSSDLGAIHVYDSNRIRQPKGFPLFTSDGPQFDGLNASWIEGVFSFKTGLFNNVYLGASLRLGFLLTENSPDNFDNLWIPGFNKVTDGARFGLNVNYTLSYLIPILKR